MTNAHQPYDLKQLQSLPLEFKIRMTQERIKAWYESWTKFEIIDDATGKTRYETIDTRDYMAEPKMKETEWYRYAWDGQVYISWSGGIDSTVLKHIVDSMYDDVPSVFVNTGLEYPEIQKFVKDVKAGRWDCFNSDVVILRPEMRFDEVLKTHGYPVVSKRVSGYVDTARRHPDSMRAKWLRGEEWTKFVTGGKWAFLIDAPFPSSAKCCDIMKKAPLHKYVKGTGRRAIIGTMAYESPNREQSWIVNGCNAFEAKTPISQPLAFWTKQDILHYIKKYNVPYCPVYGDIVLDDSAEFDGQINAIDYLGCYEPEDKLKTTGCNRTGCIFCAFGCHLEKEPNRFQKLKETHPRQYDYCIDGGEYVWTGKVLTSGGWREVDFIDDDGTPMTPEQIAVYIENHKDNENFRFEQKWQPSKEGLGLGKVLDYIGVKY